MAPARPLSLLTMVHESAIANLPPEPSRRVTVWRLTSVHPTMCSVSRPYELLPVRDMLETYESRLALAWLKLGGAVGVAAATVQRWELGRRRPRGTAALRYAALLSALEQVNDGT